MINLKELLMFSSNYFISVSRNRIVIYLAPNAMFYTDWGERQILAWHDCNLLLGSKILSSCA